MSLRSTFLPLLLTAAMCCGCEYDFDLAGSSSAPRLYVNCLAGYGDSTFVDIQTVTSLNSGITRGDTVRTEIESISFKVDGTEQELFPLQHIDSSIYNIFYIPRRIKPGEEVIFSARAKGLPEVSAGVSMPAAPVIDSIAFTSTKVNKQWREVRFDVQLGSGVTADGYYGVTLMCRDPEGYYSLYISSVSDEESLSGNGEETWLDCGISRFGVESFAYDYDSRIYDAITLIEGRTLLARDSHIRFSARAPRDSELSVRVSTVTPSMYRYARSCYQQGNNILANLGLAPAIFSYSNVSGGFGAFCGMSSVISETFKP